MKLIQAALGVLVLLSGVTEAQQPLAHPVLPYQNVQLPPEQRITDLLSRMTPEEKISSE